MEIRKSLAECEIGEGVIDAPMFADLILPEGQSFQPADTNPTEAQFRTSSESPAWHFSQLKIPDKENEGGGGDMFAWVRRS